METEISQENIILTPAEKYYRNHLKNVLNYQKKHPEKMREKCKNYNKRLKEENPEKYQAMLDRKKNYYINHVKPSRENRTEN